jgi:hypothetical protein
MSDDLFEQLATNDVPPPPETLHGDVHRRLNRVLLLMQVTEFLFQTMLYALMHFARGVLGLIVFTFSGRFVVDRQDSSSPDRPEQTP